MYPHQIFKDTFADVIGWHIPHIPHLESATNTVHIEVVHQLKFGGDQLTSARARRSQEARLNSDTCLGKLQGLKPMAEDWHTSVILLTVCVLKL